MFRHIVSLVLVTGAAALAQTNINSITVSASRTNNLQPDQVVFGVTVNSPLTTGRDDVIAAVSGSGIGLANFTGVSTLQSYSGTQFQTTLGWSFSLTAPMANLKTTVDQLTGLQMSLSKAGGGLSLAFSVQGTGVSAQAEQAQPCSLAGLLSDARSQALAIANAANMTLGPVLALSSQYPGSCSVTATFAVAGGF